MYDVAQSLETIVWDDPDDPEVPVVAFGRAGTEELTVQTFVLSQWHRRMPVEAETSCGVPIPRGSFVRREVLTERAVDDRPKGRLCCECFTAHERTRAAKADQDAADKEQANWDRWLADAPNRAEQREKSQDEVTVRLRALRNVPIKGDK